MDTKIEKVLGSWDLEVDSYSYLVVYVEREESTDFWWQNFIFSRLQVLFLGTLYSWRQVLNGGLKVSLLDFVDKIMYESLRAWWFLYLPLLYMGVTPLVSHLYSLD